MSGGSTDDDMMALAPESRKAFTMLGGKPYLPVEIIILSLHAPTCEIHVQRTSLIGISVKFT